jgi:TRAP-type transport system periplasmic protein
MTTRHWRVASLLVLALTAAACGGSGGGTEGTEGSSSTEPISIRFSCSCVPTDFHTKAIYRFEEEVEAATDGAVDVEVFDSASLYDQTAEQTALLRGDLEMAYASPQWVAEEVPAAGITGVPYLIEDVDHLYSVMDGEVGQQIFNTVVEEAGIRPLTSLYLGTRELNLTDIGHKVMTPADLAGVKLRVPDADSWIKMGEALGANPAPLAFSELYLALQTGTVEGQDNPLPTTENAKLYEVTDQIVLTDHMVNDVWPTVNEEFWQTLPADIQEAIVEAWKVARDEATQAVVAAETEAVPFLEEQGLEVYEPDVPAFRDTVLNQYLSDPAQTSVWIPGMLEQIQGLAA